MPADLTAAEIISLLRERPGCCKSLSVQLTEYDEADLEVHCDDLWCITGVDDECEWRCFRRWLTGACVEKCHELGIDVVRANSSGSEWYFGPRNRCIESDVQLYPTFLHAATAAIEAHCKETT